MKKKVAFITGITGQDASYLAELLIEKNYKVHGLIRRVAVENQEERLSRILHIKDKIKLHYGTLESYPRICQIIEEIKPDECYHLAANSFVKVSFEDEFSTMNTNINGAHYILSAINRYAPKCKVYIATSSEMFGKVQEIPQTEKTPFYPRSIYGITKVADFYLAQYYREAYNLFACSGILFNHESPRRGIEFVTRKITNAVAKIKLGKQKELRLGNIESKRDWGHSRDYVYAQWLMLQRDKPDDFIIATNEVHSVKEFLQEAFGYVGLNWQDYVVIDPKFYRPADVNLLIGDYSKARKKLKWKPKIKFKKLVRLMMDNDLEIERKLENKKIGD